MEALYKRKTKVGLGNREKRKELNKMASKAKREEMIDSKRRMPLGELNLADPGKTGAEPKKSKADERLKQLREWQKARQEAKAKANASKDKKPVFVLGKSSSVNFTPQVNSKGKTVPQKNKEGLKTAFLVQKPAVKPAPREGSKRIPPKVKKSTPTKRLQPAQQDVQRPKRVKPILKTQEPKTKSESVTKTRSTIIAQRPKSATNVAKKSEPRKGKYSTTSSTGSAASARQTRATSRTKEAVQQPSQQITQQEPSPRKATTKMTAVTPPPATPPPQPLIIEVPPTTPSKKSYMPVCPSPLLRSRSASCRACSEPTEPPPSGILVDEPAWIPGASAPDNSTSNKFGDFIDSFSPFKFGNSESNFQFNFNKDLPQKPANCNNVSTNETTATTSPENAITCSPEATGTCSSSDEVRGRRRRSRVVRKSEEGDMVPVVSAADEEMVATSSEEVTDGIDIPRFRKLHSDVCEKLVFFCEVWEAKKTTLEESNEEFEEVLGQIRTATGSAQLLMKQKLKQYIGLVDTAESQSGHRKTTAEDLQGFWDMVYYQVEGLFKMFADLDELERNNWVSSQPSPKKPKLQRKKNISSRKPKKTAGSEAARIKMMERREELKKLKMKAKQQVLDREKEVESSEAEEVKEEEVTAESMVPVKETESTVESVDQLEEMQSMMENVKLPDMEETCQKEKSETCELTLKKREMEDAVPPSPLRRSARIRNRSIFSPMCSPVLSARRPRNTPKKGTQEDAPIGLLISF